jgi:hypothetical protein
MFALGTNSGMLKIFSLKGYEMEVHDAHDDPIVKVGFVPNKGFLVSIDNQNVFKLWKLADLDDCEIQQKIPSSAKVTVLYVPAFITSQPLNH